MFTTHGDDFGFPISLSPDQVVMFIDSHRKVLDKFCNWLDLSGAVLAFPF